jgi:aspartate racemase
MQGRFYPDVLQRHGVTLVLPTPDEQAFIHDRYMNELVDGRFLPETRASFVAIAARLYAQEGIQALILGGTELPLLLRNATECPVPLLDSTALNLPNVDPRQRRDSRHLPSIENARRTLPGIPPKSA